MEEAHQQENIEVCLEPLFLELGSEEEKATFSRLSVVVNGCNMTEGVALDSKELQPGPCVSGYHLAEWFVMNWWRQAFEPRLIELNDDTTMDWDFAHWMSAIGEGYIWPNIEVTSDGFRVSIESVPSKDPYANAFRFVGARRSAVITVTLFQEAIETLINSVLRTLEGARIRDTQLHVQWASLQEEIGHPDTALKRRIEAMLGFDRNEADPTELSNRLADCEKLGENAVAELVAEANVTRGQAFTESDIRQDAKNVGFDGRVEDILRPSSDTSVSKWGTSEAWRIGATTARAVREYANLNGKPVDNRMLARMAGTSEKVITDCNRVSKAISFAMDNPSGTTHIVMRSKRQTGRRFDLARLIADRLFQNDISDPLLPVTQSNTYRQQAQRAFAAEVLAPVDAVEDFLNGDRSEENFNEAAEHFDVSPLLIRSLLMNRNRV